MPKKTAVKKTAKATKVAPKSPKQTPKHSPKHHVHFSAFMALFVGLTSYAFVSLFITTNDSLDRLSASVLHADGAEVADVVADADVVDSQRENPFVDVQDSDPNVEAIVTLYYDGLIQPDLLGNFYPEKAMNRAEFTKLVLDAADVDLASFGDLTNCFSDVTNVSEQWFAAHACAAKAMGVIKGVDGAFKGAEEVKQAEALKIVLTAFGFDIDEDEALPWYTLVQQAAVDNDLIAESTEFDPAKTLSRAEVARIVAQAISEQ